MHAIYAVAGVLLVVLTLLDALWTTLWVDGAAGPLTRYGSSWSWRAALAACGRTRHKLLSGFGPLILVTTVVSWVVFLLAGWVLLFGAESSSLSSSSGAPIDWSGRIWFVAYTIFTVGNGDYKPQPGFWQVISSLVAASGMMLVTLAISYVLSVLSAVVGKRAFATQVYGLGDSAEALVLSGWNGRDLRALDRQLAEFSSQLSKLTQQYQSYPVLQYYHAAKEKESPVKAAAILDDALTLIHFGVAEQSRPDMAAVKSARSAVEGFLGTLGSALLSPAEKPPAPPELDGLRRQGVPTVDEAAFRRALEGLEDRRRAMLGLVQGDGWRWSR